MTHLLLCLDFVICGSEDCSVHMSIINADITPAGQSKHGQGQE